MAAPKRRGLEYQLLCQALTGGHQATYVIAQKVGKPRSVVKRALTNLERRGLVSRWEQDRSGGSGPSYDATKMDFIDGRKKKVFVWARVQTGKAGQKVEQRCERPFHTAIRHKIYTRK
jgi:predicted transcriptional regulator